MCVGDRYLMGYFLFLFSSCSPPSMEIHTPIKFTLGNKTCVLTGYFNSVKVGRWLYEVDHVIKPMIGENRQLVTDEPVEFEE